MENPLKTPRDNKALSIAQRREDIINRMAASAKQLGQMTLPDLVAVSKIQPDERVKAVIKTGQKIFGENRVQEAQSRWADTFKEARSDIELRLIGPLQSNKAEEAAVLFDVIETLDREKLARALAKAADKIGQLPRLYVQVNTGEEPQKSGIAPQSLSGFLKTLSSDYDIHPEGLMCIPPVGQAPSPHFWLLSKLAHDNGLEKLSMGMSGDYETAIEMGATSVRVGSALFGARDYN
ncbi:MAG: YggS family pyridoxal phosphate-dependent enzyme [Litorimonas sp.]